MHVTVPSERFRTAEVRGQLRQMFAGAISGANVNLRLDLTDPLSGTFEYRSTCSNSVTTTVDAADIISADKIVRKTGLRVDLASLPSPTVDSSDRPVVSSFVLAAGPSAVGIKKLTFEIKLRNIGNNPITVFIPHIRQAGQDPLLLITPSMTGQCSTVAEGLCYATVVFVDEQIIQPNTSVHYYFAVSSTGTDVVGESIETRLLGDQALITGALTGSGSMIGIDGTQPNVIWSDLSAPSPRTTTSRDRTNGLYVPGLPSAVQTLVHIPQ
jgi:hypothetical protein